MSPKLIILRPHTLHLFTTFKLSFSTTTRKQTQTTLSSYGPALHKGTTYPLTTQNNDNPSRELYRSCGPIIENNENNNNIINKDEFTRVFNISALRVPANYCFALEARLRGHLLNWPRIRNIARVPGDDIDPEFDSLLTGGDGDGAALQRRVYGKAEGDGAGAGMGRVLYREELAREFDSRGYVRFRNLARMSRPKRKKRGERSGEGSGDEGGGGGRNAFSTVEVVEEGGGEEEEEEEEEDLRGLLGDGFKGLGKWRGSTRLLLLDERYADRGIEELPEAVKAVLKEDTAECGKSICELVRCKLTLFYDYWQMYEILEAILPTSMIVPSAFETVGHIAHLNLRDEHLPYKKVIAKVVLDKNMPKIRTVVNKLDAIHNDYRTMELEVLAGNHSLVTTVVESGLRFNVDLATVYWNSRLATERQRLVNGFTRNDVICDVFSGVGPIALCAAKIVKRVYANDLNPRAVEYLERNSVLNKLERRIQVFNMDGRRFINAMFTSEKAESITQVIMNLPNDAAEFLDAFRGVFRDRPRDKMTRLPKIHVYGFSKAEDPEFDFHKRIRIALSEVAVDVEMRRVRVVAPGKWMLCASFILPESVARGQPVIDL